MLNIFRPFLGHISLGLAALCLIFIALWQMERAHSAKVEKRAEYYRSELVRITEAKDKQKVITKERIVEVERKSRDADERAKRVESAPVSEKCETPREVLGADL